MNCINQKTLWVDGHGNIQVPCGKCLPCTMNKRADWSFRLEQEYKYSISAHFVTLTYDQKHCPSDGSLSKRHLQLYMKRLRKRDGTNKIRYYAVGEYGTHGGRPHYHLLLFNCQESDIRASWTDSNGHSVGIVHVGRVTAASVAYVTKYVIQKDEPVPDGMQKPFALMSRAYGIGGHYLTDEMIEWHRGDSKNFTYREGSKIRLPRFYRDKIWPNINLKQKKKKREKRYNMITKKTYHVTVEKKITRVTLSTWKVMKKKYDLTRKAVSAAAMKLTLEKQEKERQHWKKSHGNNWERAMLESRDHLLSRVKQKIAFTQRF